MTDQRKQDHINLTDISRPSSQLDLNGLYYEPLFSGHPNSTDTVSHKFIGHNFNFPLWISSMTGGTNLAKKININLAKACAEFKLGMGLGSCRSLIYGNERFEDFNVKKYMGDAPLYTNFGIAQLEELVDEGKLDKIVEITKKLEAQGIIIHVNPLQEWSQAEGDRFKHSPITTIEQVLDQTNLAVMVKEVGQGFGPNSLRALSKLPLEAIELSGFGGTNFTLLEQLRDNSNNHFNQLANIGHTNKEMITWINEFDSTDMKCKQFIVSGGIQDPFQGYILNESLNFNSVIGLASGVLKYAKEDYETLHNFLIEFTQNLLLANNFLRRE